MKIRSGKCPAWSRWYATAASSRSRRCAKSRPSRRAQLSRKAPCGRKARRCRLRAMRSTRPYQAHGSIGPSCAVAQWTDGKLQVWTHSQGVYPLRGDLANALGLEPSAVRCTHAEGAGCYGHNGADDVALDAALLARATNGRPVKLQWMRDD